MYDCAIPFISLHLPWESFRRYLHIQLKLSSPVLGGVIAWPVNVSAQRCFRGKSIIPQHYAPYLTPTSSSCDRTSTDHEWCPPADAPLPFCGSSTWQQCESEDSAPEKKAAPSPKKSTRRLGRFKAAVQRGTAAAAAASPVANTISPVLTALMKLAESGDDVSGPKQCKTSSETSGGPKCDWDSRISTADRLNPGNRTGPASPGLPQLQP